MGVVCDADTKIIDEMSGHTRATTFAPGIEIFDFFSTPEDRVIGRLECSVLYKVPVSSSAPIGINLVPVIDGQLLQISPNQMSLKPVHCTFLPVN